MFQKLLSCFLVISFIAIYNPVEAQIPLWRELAPGLDLAEVKIQEKSHAGPSVLSVLRIDPSRWELDCVGISDKEENIPGTARQWALNKGFTAVINAGMFGSDFSTHLGYLKNNERMNNNHINKYQSVMAFSSDHGDFPIFKIFDLDDPDFDFSTIKEHYKLVVQNLRLIKRPGENRWSQKDKQWSKAALGEDAQGRILFIFSRSPFSMHDFNYHLLASGIDLVCAQHLEGGPEAQMYINAGEFQKEWFGSYETGFYENDSNSKAWPVPNVQGIKSRNPKTLEPLE